MVSVTQVQRDFKNILESVVPKNPTYVLRDSTPEAVLLSLEEYKRLVSFEKDVLKMKVLADISDLAELNNKYSEKEIKKDIRYAKKHAPRSN